MSKTIIEVKCTDQVLTLTNTPVIASGGVGEDFVSIEFCPMWDDYAPSLLFWRKGVEPIPVVEDADGLFPVPAELTGVDGIVYFGAVGYDTDGNRRTSQAISYRLEAGAITEGTELPAPSGDVFDQIMAHYADVKLYVSTRIDEAADAALAAGENAKAAQSAAVNAEGQAAAALNAAANAEGQAAAAVDAAKNIVPFEPLECEQSSSLLFITVDKKHEGKMLVSFVSPCPSSEVTEVLLLRSDGAAMSYYLELRDSSGSGIGPGAFLQGDYVIALLDAEMRAAFVLNPRVTRDADDEINALKSSVQATTIVEYVGDGTDSVTLNFPEPPELIHIESLGTGGYTVSATLFCDAMKSKVRVFSDGVYSEYVRDYWGSWGKTVQVRFSDSHIPVGQLNANGVSYVAIGIM